jgi:hypothetical protein
MVRMVELAWRRMGRLAGTPTLLWGTRALAGGVVSYSDCVGNLPRMYSPTGRVRKVWSLVDRNGHECQPLS